MKARVALNTYESIIKVLSTYFHEYGIHPHSNKDYGSKHIKPQLRDTYNYVCNAWDTIMVRYIESLEQGPGVGDSTYDPHIAAAVGISAGAGTGCDLFTLSTVANFSVAMSSGHRKGIVYPLGIGGRRIPGFVVADPAIDDLRTITPRTFPGNVKDDSMFREIRGDNEFPDWIHSVAKYAMETSKVPLVILHPRYESFEKKSVIVEALPGSHVTMCSSVCAWFWWLGGIALRKAKDVALAANASLREALLFYYGGNAWEIAISNLLEIGWRPVLPVEKISVDRLISVVNSTIQMAIIMREYVLHGKTGQEILGDSSNSGGKRLRNLITGKRRESRVNKTTPAQIHSLPLRLGKRGDPSSIETGGSSRAEI